MRTQTVLSAAVFSAVGLVAGIETDAEAHLMRSPAAQASIPAGWSASYPFIDTDNFTHTQASVGYLDVYVLSGSGGYAKLCAEANDSYVVDCTTASTFTGTGWKNPGPSATVWNQTGREAWYAYSFVSFNSDTYGYQKGLVAW